MFGKINLLAIEHVDFELNNYLFLFSSNIYAASKHRVQIFTLFLAEYYFKNGLNFK